MPSRIDISVAAIAISSVAGIRSTISFSAEVPCTKEVPRSPVSAPLMKWKYWIYSG